MICPNVGVLKEVDPQSSSPIAAAQVFRRCWRACSLCAVLPTVMRPALSVVQPARRSAIAVRNGRYGAGGAAHRRCNQEQRADRASGATTTSTARPARRCWFLSCARSAPQPIYHVPHRIEEGYGLNVEGLRGSKSAASIWSSRWIAAFPMRVEVAAADEMGLDIVVVDHHQPPRRTAAGALR